ncbi:AAA family ATPase [Paenibacillus wenxiniae]|uniref:CpaE family protein n=1 Tax=Paenibacillus wenxiniae TaxID=1636843 RepID=A0ABW4RI58_9BACL
MAPIQMILCVEDQEYIELLLRYIRSSEYAARVTIRAFSDVQMFLNEMEEGRYRGLVVAEDIFLQSWLVNEQSTFTSVRWVRLGDQEEQQADGHTIAKYQPLPHLMEQLCHFIGRTGIESPREAGRAWVTCVYSAVAGSGKSVTAMNMAKQLGVKGKSVFYLNLEPASSVSLLQLEADRNMPELSRLLYDLQAAAEQKQALSSIVTDYTVYAEEIRAETFIPPANLNEWLRMTVEEMARLIDYIADSGQYDHVIIDSESGWAERVQAALNSSDRVIWLLTDDLPCMKRTEQWISYWKSYYSDWLEQLEPKLSFVINRYNGSVMNALPSGIYPASTLPYVPSWKQVTSSELLWCSPIFQRDILKLCHLEGERIYDGVRASGGVSV